MTERLRERELSNANLKNELEAMTISASQRGAQVMKLEKLVTKLRLENSELRKFMPNLEDYLKPHAGEEMK